MANDTLFSRIELLCPCCKFKRGLTAQRNGAGGWCIFLDEHEVCRQPCAGSKRHMGFIRAPEPTQGQSRPEDDSQSVE